MEEYISVSVYLKEAVPENDILKLQTEISKLPEVKEVQYVAKEMALDDFLKRHKQNPTFLEAIEVLGENPFLAALHIKVKEEGQYQAILGFLEKEGVKEMVDRHSFYESQAVVEKIYSLGSSVKNGILVISGIFAFITVLIVFNTIKLAIYSQKEEILIMRSIGASNFYIQGPFILEGILLGVFASLLSFAVWVTLSFALVGKIEIFLAGFNVLEYFIENIFVIALVQVLFGISLGVFSSFICTRKYLKA